MVEGKPYVFQCIGSHSVFQSVVFLQPIHHMFQSYSMLGTEVDAKSLVEFGDDTGEILHLLKRYFYHFGLHRIKFIHTSVKVYPSSPSLLQAIGFHINILLNLSRQFILSTRQ